MPPDFVQCTLALLPNPSDEGALVPRTDHSNPPTVQVVIPNWNGCHLLGPCLESLGQQTYRDFQVVVVDNGSTDGSRSFLAGHYPEVRSILNNVNRGFSPAVNQGIRATESDLVVILNNDTVVDREWLASLVAAASANPDVGMFACKLVLAKPPGMLDSAGISVDRLGFAWDRLGGTAVGEADEQCLEVFGPSGGAALYRRRMLEEVGLFDEEFFAYLEDVDLAWRARTYGWRCLYVPQAKVIHHHSATAREGSPFKSYQLGRNKVWLLVKNYPVRRLWYYIPLVLLYDLAAVVYGVVRRGDVNALRGRLDGLLQSAPMVRKRQIAPELSRADLEYLEPVRWPWQIRKDLAYLDRL